LRGIGSRKVTKSKSRKGKKSKRQEVEESKSQKVAKSKSGKGKESKSRRVKKSKSPRVEELESEELDKTGGGEVGDLKRQEEQAPGKVRSFEDLWIWQQARALAGEVYRDFGAGTRSARDWDFNGQIRRAAVSIVNNIAEGFERASDAEFARFLYMAKGSCGEVRSMYHLAEDLNYVDSDVSSRRRDKVRQIAAGIASLIAHLKA
jgi:four helix bundle protein